VTAEVTDSNETREQPAANATYEELVDDHGERLYGLVMLLLGDAAAAEAVILEAYRYTWDELDRGLIVGDQIETLFRAAIQRAIRRLSRSTELRGLLPATTADDHQVTAYGIVHQLIPEHRAAILGVLWGGLDYRLAGIASGTGAERTRDAIYSARQEYREAYGAGADSPACREIAPALSLRADGELEGDELARAEAHLASCGTCPTTVAAFAEFTSTIRALRVPGAPDGLRGRLLAIPNQSTRPTGWRRLLGLATGPALLVIALGVGLFALQQCAEPTIKTGKGRTSDVIYASRGDEGTVILDAGSGRELGRLPLSVLGRAGHEAYGTGPRCGPGDTGTTIRAADAGTTELREIGCAEGNVKVLAADDITGRVLLGDALGNREQLLVFDVRQGRVISTITADETLTGVFAGVVELAPDGTALVSTTAVAERGRARFAVAETDLEAQRIVGIAEIPEPCGADAALLAPGRDEVYAYQPACGRLHELHPRSGRPSRSIDLGEASSAGASRALLAAAPNSDLLYALVPGGGIVIVDRTQFQEVRRLNPERRATGIASSTDGAALYTTTDDGSYVVIDAGSGRTLLRRGNLGNLRIIQVNAGE
jgi:DNA-directed RNA polymerase specialized sigma24 family protein